MVEGDEGSLDEDLEDVGGGSSKSGTRIIENTADDEDLDEDLQGFGSGVFDQDVYEAEGSVGGGCGATRSMSR